MNRNSEKKVMWRKNSPYIYEKFAMELQDYAKTGELPKHSDQDMKYSMELQRERLREQALTMEYEFVPRGAYSEGGGYAKGREDARYMTTNEYRTCKTTKAFYRDGRRVFKKKSNDIFYQVVTDIKDGTMIGDDLYTCPSCGAINTFSVMEDGCPNCHTHFDMSDIYPKVTNYFFVEDAGGTEKEVNRSLKSVMIPSIVIGIIVFTVFSLLNSEFDNELIGRVPGAFVSGIMGGILGGGIFGYMIWAFSKLGGIFVNAGKSARLVVGTMGSESKYVNFMRQYSPDFSYEYFKDKAVSLLKMIVFSKDATKLPIYAGQPIGDRFYNIVDMTYTGAVGLRQYNVQNGFCNVVADVYMDIVYSNGGKLGTNRAVFTMSLSKNVSKPVDMYFSVSQIRCKSCGGSFDALKTANCPNCGSRYDVGDDDWIVTGVQMR